MRPMRRIISGRPGFVRAVVVGGDGRRAAGRADGPGVANADGAAVGSRVGSAEGRFVGLSVLSQQPKCPMLPSARMPGQHCPVSCIALQRGCA